MSRVRKLCATTISAGTQVPKRRIWTDLEIGPDRRLIRALIDPDADMNAIPAKLAQELEIKSCELERKYILGT